MTARLRTVRLYGPLGVKFGRCHQLVVSSPREAMIALAATVPGFEQYIIDCTEGGIDFAVFIGKRNLNDEQIDDQCGGQEIRIAPIIRGSKQAGLFQVIVGVVLLVAGFVTGGTTWGPAMVMLGAGLAVSGAITMATTQAKTKESGDKGDSVASSNFNGAVNTVAQGNPVPLAYGRNIVGSAVISAAIYPEDKA